MNSIWIYIRKIMVTQINMTLVSRVTTNYNVSLIGNITWFAEALPRTSTRLPESAWTLPHYKTVASMRTHSRSFCTDWTGWHCDAAERSRWPSILRCADLRISLTAPYWPVHRWQPCIRRMAFVNHYKTHTKKNWSFVFILNTNRLDLLGIGEKRKYDTGQTSRCQSSSFANGIASQTNRPEDAVTPTLRGGRYSLQVPSQCEQQTLGVVALPQVLNAKHNH